MGGACQTSSMPIVIVVGLAMCCRDFCVSEPIVLSPSLLKSCHAGISTSVAMSSADVAAVLLKHRTFSGGSGDLLEIA